MKILKGSARFIYLFGVEAVGWLLIAAGVAALVLPGPGVLLLFAGLVVLSNRYAWAGRMRHKAEGWVEESTRASVQNKKRIAFSLTSALLGIFFGFYIMEDPTLPTWAHFSLDLKLFELVVGPKIPGASLTTGIVMILTGLLAISLVIVGIVKYKNDEENTQA